LRKKPFTEENMSKLLRTKHITDLVMISTEPEPEEIPEEKTGEGEKEDDDEEDEEDEEEDDE